MLRDHPQRVGQPAAGRQRFFAGQPAIQNGIHQLAAQLSLQSHAAVVLNRKNQIAHYGFPSAAVLPLGPIVAPIL